MGKRARITFSRAVASRRVTQRGRGAQDERTRGKRLESDPAPPAWHTDRESLLYFAVRAVVQSLLCNRRRAIVRPHARQRA